MAREGQIIRLFLGIWYFTGLINAINIVQSWTKRLAGFYNFPIALPRERRKPPSAYLPFSERLMKNLANPYKPISPTLYEE